MRIAFMENHSSIDQSSLCFGGATAYTMASSDAGKSQTSRQTGCASQPPSENDYGKRQQNLRFYQQCQSLRMIAYQVFLQKLALQAEGKKLIEKIEEVESGLLSRRQTSHSSSGIDSQLPAGKKARRRRLAGDIDRKFKCVAPKCEKQYGLEGSLINHIKIKHPDVYYSRV